MNFKTTLILFIVLFVALSLFSLLVQFPVWVFYVLIALFFLLLTVGSFSMSRNFFLKSFTELKSNPRNTVALTFDDGPHPLYTPQVLALLKQYNATATFFCIGKNAEKYPALVQQIIADGHFIGNHSFSHKPHIGFNGTKCWINELKKTDTVLETILGEKPTLFRPPYGVTTPHLAKAIEFTNHTVVGWNIRTYDTSPIRHKDAMLKYIKMHTEPGSVILLHDTHQRIPYVLEHTLIYLQEHGYKTVSINNLMDE
ncbi:polysaccharide deacetylase family protein [Rasiella sp. SM2506]|uniref:polysaccharide deacetylase family protein n=1 Tax=Rasiella sp. SM2506 TaxID=3423914 RepID=UPI003D78B613